MYICWRQNRAASRHREFWPPRDAVAALPCPCSLPILLLAPKLRLQGPHPGLQSGPGLRFFLSPSLSSSPGLRFLLSTDFSGRGPRLRGSQEVLPFHTVRCPDAGDRIVEPGLLTLKAQLHSDGGEI